MSAKKTTKAMILILVHKGKKTKKWEGDFVMFRCLAHNEDT